MTPPLTSVELLEPISPDQPCGQNLEDTPLLASFDSYRLYGRTRALDAPPEQDPDGPKTVLDREEEPPDWVEIRDKSVEALKLSKDLRVLAHLGTAVLRTDGLPAFLDTLKVAGDWLSMYWDTAYPPVDGDGIERRSALNCFADPAAVIDALRRAPLVSSRQHGVFSLRDIDIATAQMPAGKNDTKADESQINGAFGDLPLEDLTGLEGRVSAAVTALKAIDAKMREEVGTEAAPSFEGLSTQLSKINKVLRAQIAARPGATADGEVSADGQAAAATGFSGAVRSRQEAIRALDAVADFFRRNEPSSPVPMFCDRAKRLVNAGSFLDVLAEIAPEAVAQARAAGGVRD